MRYRDAGVDIDAASRAKARIKRLARQTFSARVLKDVGAFGGFFALQGLPKDAVLVASVDGVGTKLKIACALNRHSTVGADIVNHCVNDIAVHGAAPLFFLDYLATGQMHPEVVAEIVGGLARACRAVGCALIGGETADMPDVYAPGAFDLAGFIVGVVERDRIIDGRSIRPGDLLIGIPSSGLHTNGYSLARRIVFNRLNLNVDSFVPEIGSTVGEALLRMHRSYLRLLEPLLDEGRLLGLAHITGGGITDNLPRILPAGSAALIRRSAWEVPSIFRFLQEAGEVPIEDMYRTFNMGIGLIAACRRADADGLLATLAAAGEPGLRVIGEIVAGEPNVTYAG